MSQPNWLSIGEAAVQLRRNEVSARSLTEACLARIAQRDARIKAWVHIDAEAALAAADRCDGMARAGHWLGPLHGIAIGVKDIFDVAGMPTAFGSDAWPPGYPQTDAASVQRLRQAGAIVLGKTVSTAFAMGDPGPTCNPWNIAHTPGGSSSGSAAAVADAMCFGALGTQTVGSVIRPCSFNGLAGIKPTHGAIDAQGVQPLSWRLDHVGALTRSLGDARLMWRVLRRDAGLSAMTGLPEPHRPRRPGRLWRCRGIFESLATAEMNVAMDSYCTALANAGIEIVERELPDDGEKILAMHQVILAAEAAAVHRHAFERYGEKYPPNIGNLIRAGRDVSAMDYLAACQYRRGVIANIKRAMTDVDAMLTPAATGAAPAGLAHTGDRQMNAPSSFMGFPVVCFPVAMGAGNLPLGLQLMGSPGSEGALLDTGEFCEALAAFVNTTESST